ncbi:MAG TPA: class I SAM-dependent methyltransferase [Verrucomicrobiae bacterium]
MNKLPFSSQSCCPVCHACDCSFWTRGRDRLLRITDDEFIYLRCGACGACFQAAPPAPAEISKFYPSDYGPYQKWKQTATPGFFRKATGKLLNSGTRKLRHRLKALYQPPRGYSVFLDYGCGSEKFLGTAKHKGWRTIGVDFSESVVEKVKAAGHGGLIAGEKLWREIPDESLTLVRMNHVIEHLYDPADVLQHLFRKLKPGGRLHLATPNPAGLGSRLFGSRWLGLDCPRHIILFSPQLVADCLKKAGFQSVEIFPEFVTKDVARSAGFLLADMGWMKHEKIPSLVDAPLGVAVLALPCFIAAKINLCDRYHVIAQKC